MSLGDTDLEEGGFAPDLVSSGELRASESAGFQPVYADVGFIQRLRYRAGDHQTLEVENSYENMSGTGYDSYYYYYSTSYLIRSVATLTKNKWFMLGDAGGGNSVIERWTGKKVLKPGNPWNPGDPVTMARSLVYTGTQLGSIREFDVDPDGRFLLIAHANPVVLTRIDLAPGHAQMEIYSSNQIPYLAGVVRMKPMQHVTQGRLWVLESESTRDVLLLNDLTNDGAFESWDVVPVSTWKSDYTGAVWSDDFVNVWE